MEEEVSKSASKLREPQNEGVLFIRLTVKTIKLAKFYNNTVLSVCILKVYFLNIQMKV